MAIVDALLPEYDRETGLTRLVLERVPDGQFDFRPHPSSMTLGRLAEHLAELAHWTRVVVDASSIDTAAGRPEGYESPATREAALRIFDAGVASGRAALSGRTDAELQAPWTLLASGREVFTMPKISVLRAFVLNHLIHHRGQMTVHLRMLGARVPSLYGPSGDEKR